MPIAPRAAQHVADDTSRTSCASQTVPRPLSVPSSHAFSRPAGIPNHLHRTRQRSSPPCMPSTKRSRCSSGCKVRTARSLRPVPRLLQVELRQALVRATTAGKDTNRGVHHGLLHAGSGRWSKAKKLMQPGRRRRHAFRRHLQVPPQRVHGQAPDKAELRVPRPDQGRRGARMLQLKRLPGRSWRAEERAWRVPAAGGDPDPARAPCHNLDEEDCSPRAAKEINMRRDDQQYLLHFFMSRLGQRV